MNQQQNIKNWLTIGVSFGLACYVLEVPHKKSIPEAYREVRGTMTGLCILVFGRIF